MTREDREPFSNRYRRHIGFGGWLGGVLLTVVLYNVTAPRPTRLADGGRQVSDGETIQVGALPVT